MFIFRKNIEIDYTMEHIFRNHYPSESNERLMAEILPTHRVAIQIGHIARKDPWITVKH